MPVARPVRTSRLALFLLLALPTSFAAADILELNDGNLIECKLLRKEKKGSADYLVIADEEGKEKRFAMKRVKSFIRTKTTSWDLRREREEWYADKSKDVKDGWKAQERFARKCSKKRLDEQAMTHYKAAYNLRRPSVEETEKDLMRLATWLEKCELFDEAQEERRAVYVMKRKELPDTVKDHKNLAKWCQRYELLEQAAEQYEAALKLTPGNTRLEEAAQKVRNQLSIPMDNGFYRAARVRVAAAARYIRGNQAGDGSIGSDINEAGVHGIAGMTALCAMALLSDWDFGVLAGKYEADEVPKEVMDAIDFLIGFEPTNTRLAGDDMWGPIFSLDLMVQCYNRPVFAEKKDELAGEIKRLIEILVRLQRKDGGWYYYNFVDKSASFVTASVVVSLVNAANAGFKVNRGMISSGVSQINALRQGHGTFTYSTGLAQGPVGACARSPVCELALTVAGAGKPSSLRYAVDIFFKNRHILERLKGKAGTHIGEGKTAPYYLLFAHYWTSRAIKHLDRNVQRTYLNGLGGGLVAYQESDATFGDWSGTADYKVYGTALAALTLYHIASLKAAVTELKPEDPDAEEDEDDEDEDGEDDPESEDPDNEEVDDAEV